MTGSYSRMLFNSPLNGYLYAFRIGVQKYFLSFFVFTYRQHIPFNVYFYISNEVALNVNLILNSLAKRATTVPDGLSRRLQSLMLDEDLYENIPTLMLLNGPNYKASMFQGTSNSERSHIHTFLLYFHAP
jgi:hypothetical protein